MTGDFNDNKCYREFLEFRKRLDGEKPVRRAQFIF